MSENLTVTRNAPIREFFGTHSETCKEVRRSFSRGEMIHIAQKYCLKVNQNEQGDINQGRYRLDFGLLVDFINRNFPREDQ